jgi:methionyl-tRNA formyltransferase
MRSVFMGSPEFALPVLESLAAQTTVVGVVTQPDRPSGRGREVCPSPVKILADRLGLPVIQPEKLRAPEALVQLRAWEPEVIVVAAYGQILRPEVLNLPGYGCLNLHASLLPRHRGASPITAAILAGDAETGITLMQMDPGMDTGPILGQRRIPIDPFDTAESLGRKLSLLAAETLTQLLPVYLRGEMIPRPQENALATHAPQLRKEDGRLDFQQPAALLARKVRAYHPWPGAYITWKEQPLRILAAEADSSVVSPAPGLTAERAGFPAIYAADGLLVLRKVQPAGRRPMAGDEFFRGARDFPGHIVK